MGTEGRREESNSGKKEKERVRKAETARGARSGYLLPCRTGLYTLPPPASTLRWEQIGE